MIPHTHLDSPLLCHYVVISVTELPRVYQKRAYGVHKSTKNDGCQLTLPSKPRWERAYTRDVRIEQKDRAGILGLCNKHSEVATMFSIEERGVQFLLFSSPWLVDWTGQTCKHLTNTYFYWIAKKKRLVTLTYYLLDSWWHVRFS